MKAHEGFPFPGEKSMGHIEYIEARIRIFLHDKELRVRVKKRKALSSRAQGMIRRAANNVRGRLIVRKAIQMSGRKEGRKPALCACAFTQQLIPSRRVHFKGV